nr:MAG: thioredoxin-like disulfide oxidoreductase [uncultured archaeon]
MSDNKEKNYMLVQDGCGACSFVAKVLKESIKQNKIILLDVNSKKGAELVEKHEIESVPTIINENNDFQQKCFIGKNVKSMFCENGTEKELIKESE